MVLSKTEIEQYVNKSNMIEFHNPLSIKYSSYKIRIGKIIEPQTGKTQILNGEEYLLESNKVVLFQSKEKLKIPDDITASYSALYSISSKGILLINASMIEPGYYGHLSGVLLNFSAKTIHVYEDQEIAKVNFFRLNKKPENIIPEEIIDSEYIKNIKGNAIDYHKSFLNIDGIEKSISEKVLGHVKSLIVTGGVIIAFLILFATLEPIFSKWIWEKTGVATNSEKYKMEEILKDINQTKSEIENIYKYDTKLIKLQQQIDSLKLVVIESKKNE